jgi:hypothetical protein
LKRRDPAFILGHNAAAPQAEATAMTPIGQHRDDYDDEEDFLSDVFDRGFTCGAMIARLESCGLRPCDLSPALGLDLGVDPDWADGRTPISITAVEIIARIDGVRTDVRDALISRHRHSRTPVTLTVYRTTNEARRASILEDAGRAYHTDRAVPDFAAVHRVASVQACARLVELGVFAVVQFDDDPNPGGTNHVCDSTPTTDADDDTDDPFAGLR